MQVYTNSPCDLLMEVSELLMCDWYSAPSCFFRETLQCSLQPAAKCLQNKDIEEMSQLRTRQVKKTLIPMFFLQTSSNISFSFCNNVNLLVDQRPWSPRGLQPRRAGCKVADRNSRCWSAEWPAVARAAPWPDQSDASATQSHPRAAMQENNTE